MAIEKSFTDPTTQIQASYWDISILWVDQINSITDCALSLYASQAAKKNGAQPIYSIDFSIQGVMTADQCFAYIIANYPQFSGATIV